MYNIVLVFSRECSMKNKCSMKSQWKTDATSFGDGVMEISLCNTVKSWITLYSLNPGALSF